MAKKKIAILGGGVGAVTTAFALTSQKGWQEQYEITFYQLGWRLGGKGASGRNTDPKNCYRIEEHGLHIWLGFYDNAFKYMRACYEELNRPPNTPLATLDDAFKPQNYTVIMDDYTGVWERWPSMAKSNNYVPGVGGLTITTLKEGQDVQHMWDYVQAGLNYLYEEYQSIDKTVLKAQGGSGRAELETIRQEMWGKTPLSGNSFFVNMAQELSPHFSPPEGFLENLAENLAEAVKGKHPLLQAVESWVLPASGENVGEALIQAIHSFGLILQQDYWQDGKYIELTDETVKGILDFILNLIQRFLQWITPLITPLLAQDTKLRRSWVYIGLGFAMINGAIQEDVITKGFEAVDHLEYREFLTKYGVGDDLFLQSPPVRAWYDLVFGFEDGDPNKGNVAASVTLRSMIRMSFTYKGAFMWEMQAGMGDTIFGPYYEVLQRRGVTFKYFQRVNQLHVGEVNGKQTITSLDLSEQAQIKDGKLYAPLLTINGLPSWPSTPLYDQIVDGEKLAILIQEGAYTPEGPAKPEVWTERPYTLQLGTDYDQIVLGISLGALPEICGELKVNHDWAAMLEQVKTVRTQAFQLWLKTDTFRGLGWNMPKVVLSAYQEPLDTWSDMSHLIPREAWPPLDGQYPMSIAYFCGPLLASIPPDQADEAVKQNALHYLQNNINPLWPNATSSLNPEGLEWHLLVDLHNEHNFGPSRFDSQYWRSNWYGSELYVLSVKNSTQYRLRDSGFEGLFLAGDWTNNGFNAGCVEAGTMSGLLASNAMIGYPALDSIVGLNF